MISPAIATAAARDHQRLRAGRQVQAARVDQRHDRDREHAAEERDVAHRADAVRRGLDLSAARVSVGRSSSSRFSAIEVAEYPDHYSENREVALKLPRSDLDAVVLPLLALDLDVAVEDVLAQRPQDEL